MVQRSLVLTLALSLAWQGTPFAGRAAAAAAAVVPVDGGWPRAYTTGSGARLVLYEPQVASWADEKRIVMEILTGIVRAGADFVLTYHAKDAARWLKER